MRSESAGAMVSIEDVGQCTCGQILVREGIWSHLGKGWLISRCEKCGAFIVPRHFGIAEGDAGPCRFQYLDQDAKWTSKRPEAGFDLGEIRVYTSVMELQPRGSRAENLYYHVFNVILDLKLRWRTWRKALRGKMQKISST